MIKKWYSWWLASVTTVTQMYKILKHADYVIFRRYSMRKQDIRRIDTYCHIQKFEIFKNLKIQKFENSKLENSKIRN